MYTVNHRFGGTTANLDPARFAEVLREVAKPDDEHPDVSLTHETGWCLSYFHSGLLVFENVEEGRDVWHVRSISQKRVIELWRALATGDIDAVKTAEAWLPGYR